VTVRRRLVLRGILAVLILVLLIVLAPLLFTPEGVKRFFLQQVEAQVGRKIEVGSVRFELLPSIKLTLSDVVIRDEDPAEIHFRAKHIALVLRAWPLLKLQVVGKRLLLDHPHLELRRDRTGRWHLIEPGPQDQAFASGMANPLALLLAIKETSIKGGELVVVDEFRPDGVRTATVAPVDLTLTSHPAEQSIKILMSAGMPSSRGASSLALEGTVSRAAPGSVEQAIGGGQPPAGVTFAGAVEVVDLDLAQLADFLGPRPVPEGIAGAATLRGQVRLGPGVAGYDMVLSEIRGEVEQLSLAGQASLSGLLTPQPTFSATFASSPIALADLTARFPVQWLNPRIQEVLTDRQVQGVVEAVTATVSGTTAPEPTFSFTGQFRVKQGQALLGEDRVRTQDIEATVFVEPDRIRIADLTALYGAFRVRGGSALILLQQNGPWIELDVTGDMAAPDLTALLVHQMAPSAFTKALKELHEVSGSSVLTFRLTGGLTQPGGLSFQGGDFILKDITCRTPALPERVEGLSGRVRVSREGVELDRLFATLGHSRVEVQGTILLDGDPTLKDFFVLAAVDTRDLAKLVPRKKDSTLGLEGMIGARLALAGRPAAPEVRAVLDLKDAAITIPAVRKPAGTAAVLEFEGHRAPSGVFTAKRVELAMPPLRLAGSGTLKPGPVPVVDASFVTGPIALAQLPAGMRIAGLEAGTLEISLDIKGKGADWRRWNLGGWIALTDGQFVTKELDAPVRNLYLRVKLVRQSAEVKQLSFRIGDSDLRTSGVVQNWARRPAVTLKAESDTLDIDLLIPKGERSPVRDLVEDLAAGGGLVGTLTIDEGRYKHLELRDVSARVTIGNGVLDIDRVSAQAHGGKLAARLVVAMPKRQPADGEVTFRVTDFPYDRLIKLLGDHTRSVEGSTTLTGTLRMNGRHPEGTLRTLDGSVQFLIKNGHIYRGTIVPRIITILNLPALLQGKVDLQKQGFPYDKASGRLVFTQGRVHTEDIVIDSPILKMTAAGDYDIPADRLDMVVVVSPLGSYSKFLQSIPLFGRLLKGDRKGFDTAIFEVKGPIAQPDVSYKPLHSLAAGVQGLAHLAFDVLKNTFFLPHELLKGEEEPAPGEDHATDAPAPLVP
jgi:uncharacterized protein involved in outer membrane biogenesis